MRLLALLNLLTRFRCWSIAAGINGVKGVKGVPASFQAILLQVADSRLRSDGRKRGVLVA